MSTTQLHPVACTRHEERMRCTACWAGGVLRELLACLWLFVASVSCKKRTTQKGHCNFQAGSAQLSIPRHHECLLLQNEHLVTLSRFCLQCYIMPSSPPASAFFPRHRFFHDFMVVQRHERFDQLLTVHHPDELQGVLQQLQDFVQPVAALGSHAGRQTRSWLDGCWSQADSTMADRYADSRSHFGGGVDRQRDGGYSDRRKGYCADVVDRHAGTLEGHRGGMSDRHHGGMSDRYAADWCEADRPHLERSRRHGDSWDSDAHSSGRRDSASAWDREGTRSRRSSHSDQLRGGGHMHSTEGTRYVEEVHAQGVHAQAGSGSSMGQQRQRGFEVQAKHGRSADEHANLPPWQPHRKRSGWDSDAPWLASPTRDKLERHAWGPEAQGLLQGVGSASGRGGRGGGWGGGGGGGRAGRPGRGERDAMVAQLLKKYADPDCKVGEGVGRMRVGGTLNRPLSLRSSNSKRARICSGGDVGQGRGSA